MNDNTEDLKKKEESVSQSPLEQTPTPVPASTPEKQAIAPQPAGVSVEEHNRLKKELEEFRTRERVTAEKCAFEKAGGKDEYFEDFKKLARLDKNASVEEIIAAAKSLNKKYPSMFKGKEASSFKSAGRMAVDENDYSPKGIIKGSDVDLKDGEIMKGTYGD